MLKITSIAALKCEVQVRDLELSKLQTTKPTHISLN